MSPRDREAGLFPPRYQASWAPQDCHFPFPLTWTPEAFINGRKTSQQQLVSCIHFTQIDILEINGCDTNNEDNEMRSLNSGSDSEQHVWETQLQAIL